MRATLPFLLTLLVCAPALAQEPAAPLRIQCDVEDADLRDVMDQIARQAGVTILTNPAVQERVNVSLRDIPWRDAVEVIARMTRCQVEDWPGGILHVHQPTLLTLAGTGMDGRHLLELAARSAGRSVLILTTVQGTIPAVDFKEVHWLEGMQTVAKLLGAVVYEREGTLVVAPADFPPPPGGDADPAQAFSGGAAVDLDVLDLDLGEACEQLGLAVQKNVLVDPSVQEQVSVTMRAVPWKDAVAALARLTGCEVEERQGIAILSQPPQVTVQASRAPLPQLLAMLAGYAGKNLAMASGDHPPATFELSNCHWLRALHLLAWAHGLTVEQGEQDMLTVSPAPGRAQARQPRPDDAITRLVDEIERAARAHDLSAYEAATQRLQGLLQRETASGPGAAALTPEDEAGLLRRIEGLFKEILTLAEAREMDALVSKFTELRQVMTEYGEVGTEQVRKALSRWNKRLDELGEVRLSIQLQIYVNDGNRLLRELSLATDRGALDHAHAQLEELVAAMREEEREVFHRNADAIKLRGQSVYERGLERLKLLALPVEVQAIVVVPKDSDDRSSALINGAVLREGDDVPGLDGVVVSRIEPSVVTLERGAAEIRLPLR